MFKPAYNAIGSLIAGIGPLDNVAALDPATYNYLYNLLHDLDEGHWTYLKLGSMQSGGFEIVKVDSPADGLVHITRGIDYTTALTHLAGTNAVYEMTAAAMGDIANTFEVTFGLQAGDGIDITILDDGNYEIAAHPVEVTSENNSIVITGEYPNFDLAVNPASNGCC